VYSANALNKTTNNDLLAPCWKNTPFGASEAGRTGANALKFAKRSEYEIGDDEQYNKVTRKDERKKENWPAA
jgi:hypothetical protein